MAACLFALALASPASALSFRGFQHADGEISELVSEHVRPLLQIEHRRVMGLDIGSIVMAAALYDFRAFWARVGSRATPSHVSIRSQSSQAVYDIEVADIGGPGRREGLLAFLQDHDDSFRRLMGMSVYAMDDGGQPSAATPEPSAALVFGLGLLLAGRGLRSRS